MSEKETVRGVIERITYQSEDSGYTVCQISLKDGTPHEELVTLVGIMPLINVGEVIVANGQWTLHRTFGTQFTVEFFEKEYPTTSAAILQYLSSKTVKGVGPKTAEKIVAAFGDDALEVIENEPSRLATVHGLTQKKATEISESFKAQKDICKIMLFCREHIGPSYAWKIHKRWGGAALDVMRRNPYQLCDEISGIGFEKADKIARSLGVEDNSPERVRSGIIYVLNYNANTNGHTLVPLDRLIELTSNLLEVDTEMCKNAIDVLSDKGKIKVEKVGSRTCVYLTCYHRAENYIKDKLDMLEATCKKIENERAEELIAKIESELDIEYDKMQRKAILHSLLGGVLILTGGPGTGKTTIIRAIIRLYKRLGIKYVLAAPTGRAAKRMTEATGDEAKTIHRLLETMRTDDNRTVFTRDDKNPLDEELVIVDEASMIDTLLMESLLRAIKPGSRLVIIGDRNQLPSVGAGMVLAELIDCQRYRTVMLTKIFRQAGESLIVTNAHAINAGEDPEIYSKRNDFFFIERDTNEAIADTVANLCVNRLPKKYGIDPTTQIQVITPSHNGAAGTNALNPLLQRALNPPSQNKKEKKFRDVVFRQGDKVMQIKNNYDILWNKNGADGCGIFNGDIGTVLAVINDDNAMLIDFEGRLTRYEFGMLEELEHAYAITVHKSQGSEYPYVIIPVYNCGDKLLTRNLLYTAVTRAQTMVILVGRPELIHAMVQNNRQAKRYTGLKHILARRSRYDGLKEN